MLTRERSILAKIEVTEGTDPTPAGATNAILCSNITVTPLGGSTASRALVYPGFGATPKIHVDSQVQVEFDVEIAGAGAAGTAPAYGPLMRGCGMSETITAGSKVEYAPISSSPESVCIYSNEGGTLHKLVGSRGNVRLNFPANNVPTYHFTMIGRWTAPSAAVLPTVDYSAFKDPLVVNKVNTPTFTLDGYAAVLESLQLDIGNKIVHRDRPNSERVMFTDRQGNGNISFETPPFATKDFIGLAKANTQIVLALVHGVTGGNIVQLDINKLQLLQPTYGDADGVRLWNAAIQNNATAGNDDFKITVK